MTASLVSGPPKIEKAPTGISGLDDITFGGLPRGRATLVTGTAGSGKSLLAQQFLVHGALVCDEPGVLITLEETTDDLIENAASVGLDLVALVDAGVLALDSLAGDTDDMVAAGSFDLDGLFIRLGAAIDTVGARRVVLDGFETLFSTLPDAATVRRELGRLLRWLRQREVTVIVTGERGTDTLTRHGIEEYVTDCVILLDHRLAGGVATRRLRIAKYRGSAHGTDEYPFLLGGEGFSVIPTRRTDAPLVSDERVGLGIPALDELMGGGVFRGTTTLVSGAAGTGKTSIAATAVAAACARGERALFLSLEESPAQVIRNMRSIGVDLAPALESGLLQMRQLSPSAMGLEEHLASLHALIDRYDPSLVALDAIATLQRRAGSGESASAVARDIDLLRGRGITTVLTALGQGGDLDAIDISVSSQVDAWLQLRNIEADGERTRIVFVIKNRGSAHSNQTREFLLTSHGIELVDVAVGPGGVLTGSRRRAYEQEAARDRDDRHRERERRRRLLEARSVEVSTQIAALQRQLELENTQMQAEFADLEEGVLSAQQDRAGEAAGRSRGASRP